jgi:uncharacterized protein YkwD
MLKRATLAVSAMSLLGTSAFVFWTVPTAKVPLSVPAVTASTSTAAERTGETSDMNNYWLAKINGLRRQKNLRTLALDKRLMDTAQKWADELGSRGELTHDRPNGETVHEWITHDGLDFTQRDSPDGWKTNFFVENIGRAYADKTTDSLHAALDEVLTSMLDEEAEGPHVRTIFHPDWNSFGAGFYFEPVSPGRVRVTMAFHYASLDARNRK